MFKCNLSAKNGMLVTHATLYKVGIFIIYILPKLSIKAKFFQLCSWAQRYGCKAEDLWEANVSSGTKLPILSHDFIRRPSSNLSSHLVFLLSFKNLCPLCLNFYSFNILHKRKRKKKTARGIEPMFLLLH